jgi:hypothetical protein
VYNICFYIRELVLQRQNPVTIFFTRIFSFFIGSQSI